MYLISLVGFVAGCARCCVVADDDLFTYGWFYVLCNGIIFGSICSSAYIVSVVVAKICSSYSSHFDTGFRRHKPSGNCTSIGIDFFLCSKFLVTFGSYHNCLFLNKYTICILIINLIFIIKYILLYINKYKYILMYSDIFQHIFLTDLFAGTHITNG